VLKPTASCDNNTSSKKVDLCESLVSAEDSTFLLDYNCKNILVLFAAFQIVWRRKGYIQGVPRSSLRHKEERSCKYVCGGEWVWNVTAFNNKYLNLATFVLATDSKSSQSNDCFLLYQITVRYKYSKWPSSESVQEWTCPDHGLPHPLKGWGVGS